MNLKQYTPPVFVSILSSALLLQLKLTCSALSKSEGLQQLYNPDRKKTTFQMFKLLILWNIFCSVSLPVNRRGQGGEERAGKSG